MLDSDSPKLYGTETKRITEVVRRNLKKFPERFSWILTENDLKNLRSQFVTLNKSNNFRGQHFKYLPYVLTEQEIMMISNLLKSDISVKVNIQIIDAFI